MLKIVRLHLPELDDFQVAFPLPTLKKRFALLIQQLQLMWPISKSFSFTSYLVKSYIEYSGEYQCTNTMIT